MGEREAKILCTPNVKKGDEAEAPSPSDCTRRKYYWIGILVGPLDTGLLPPAGITEIENGTLFPWLTVDGTMNDTSQTPT